MFTKKFEMISLIFVRTASTGEAKNLWKTGAFHAFSRGATSKYYFFVEKKTGFLYVTGNSGRVCSSWADFNIGSYGTTPFQALN